MWRSSEKGKGKGGKLSTWVPLSSKQRDPGKSEFTVEVDVRNSLNCAPPKEFQNKIIKKDLIHKTIGDSMLSKTSAT